MKVSMKNGDVVIDGRSFSGRSISINGNKVYVDGKLQDGELTGDIHITINGEIESLECHAGSVTAQNVGELSTGSGDVKCGNVAGSVRTGSGDVSCGAVGGNIRTGSGDVYKR